MNEETQGLQQAKQLILQGQYAKAEAILRLIDHPSATEMLSRIDNMRSISDKHLKTTIKKDYVTPALIVTVLYVSIWIVGLLVNVHYLGEARRNSKNPDYEVTSLGCLWSLLLVAGIGPFAAFFCFLGVVFVHALLNPSIPT